MIEVIKKGARKGQLEVIPQMYVTKEDIIPIRELLSVSESGEKEITKHEIKKLAKKFLNSWFGGSYQAQYCGCKMTSGTIALYQNKIDKYKGILSELTPELQEEFYKKVEKLFRKQMTWTKEEFKLFRAKVIKGEKHEREDFHMADDEFMEF